MFSKLMEEAQPKAAALKNTTKNITSRVANARVVTVVNTLGHKAMVNTLGVGLVLAAPMASKAKNLFGRALDKVASLAKEQKSTETK